MMALPRGVTRILTQLTVRGYQAYVVGGCVRDCLLGRTPKDWDVCTSATPEDMLRAFAGWHVAETGLKHGTLTVLAEGEPYEVTTFRVDGAYTDHRHPDGVTFVTDVREDLARRDFTVNAMAYHPDTGLVDAFGGREDLARGLIRCVGDAATRFREDALRILRALRFAAVYGFAIEEQTARAAHSLKGTLHDVAAERIRVELAKLLCGECAADILRAYADVVFEVLPWLRPMAGLDQRNPHHRWDVWEHTLHAVTEVPPTEVLRLTMLLHDCGKPDCMTVDDRGVGHFYGHQTHSEERAQAVLAYLRVDNATARRVLTLVRRHDVPLSAEPKLLKRRLNELGEEALRQLIEVRRADALGQGTNDRNQVETWAEAMREALDALLAQTPCVTLKQLAVNGGDLLAMGVPGGKLIGCCLNCLLEEVLDERLPNRREALLARAEAWFREQR